MPRMTRFGVSLEEGLLKKFDEKLLLAGYRNRSAALRDIIRQFLIAKGRLKSQTPIYAVVTLVMRRDQEAVLALSKLKEQMEQMTKGSQQHLKKGEYFLDSTILYGSSEELEKACQRFQSLKGVLASAANFLPCEPPCHSRKSPKPE